MKNTIRQQNHNQISIQLNDQRKSRSPSGTPRPKSRDHSDLRETPNIFKVSRSEEEQLRRDMRLRNKSHDMAITKPSMKREDSVKGIRRYYEIYSDFMKSSLKSNKDSFKLIGSRRFTNASIDVFLKEKDKGKIYNQFDPKFDEDIEELMRIYENKRGLDPKEVHHRFYKKKEEIYNKIEMTPLPIMFHVNSENSDILNQTERSGVAIRRLEYEITLSKKQAVEKIEKKFYQKYKRNDLNRSRSIEEEKNEAARKIQRTFKNFRFRYIMFKALFLSYIRKLQKNWRIYKFRKFKNYLKSLKVAKPNNFEFRHQDDLNFQEFIKDLYTDPNLEKRNKNLSVNKSLNDNSPSESNYLKYPSRKDFKIDNALNSNSRKDEDQSLSVAKPRVQLKGVNINKKIISIYSLDSLLKIIMIQRKYKKIHSRKKKERQDRLEKIKALGKIPLKHKIQLLLIPLDEKLIRFYKKFYFNNLLEKFKKLRVPNKFQNTMDMYGHKTTNYNKGNPSRTSNIEIKKKLNQPSPRHIMRLQEFFVKIYQKYSKRYYQWIKEIFSPDVFSKIVKFKLLDVLDRLLVNKLTEKYFIRIIKLCQEMTPRNSNKKNNRGNNNDKVITGKYQIKNDSKKQVEFIINDNIVNDHKSFAHKYSTANFRSSCNNLISRNELFTFSDYSR